MRTQFAPMPALQLAALLLAFTLLASTASAQSPPTSPIPPGTPLVVLDVVVHDQSGHPVRGLKPQNFPLTEAGIPQSLTHFVEHPSSSAAPPSFPPLPPGTFTDYTPLSSATTLNILLIDALNTPTKDQAFIRTQLRQYVQHANPNTRIAIIGLANRPILLQGFTSDPTDLRDVVERKLIPRSSAQRAPASNSSPSAIELAANLREFQSQLGALETELRLHYTLDAFNTLAHYLAGFPGRKNLLWFSASFPLPLLPNPSLALPPGVATLDQAEFHETINLLSRARVAVYPIDARTLMSPPAANAARALQSEAAEHAMMDQLATSTGGLALYHPATLADAVTTAIAAGSSYYTVAYTPTPPPSGASFRPLSIAAPTPLQLSYRRGYFTPSPNSPTSAYKQAAMSRGAPTPEDLVFKVRVLPSSTTTDSVLAPDNQLSPSVPATGPFRRFDIDFLALPSELTFTSQPDGHRLANIEFLAFVYDTEGRLLNTTGKNVSFEATPANFPKLLRSLLRCHLELSVPDRAETFLRIGLHDVTSNKFGVIELPASTLSALPPSTNIPASTAGRASPPQD